MFHPIPHLGFRKVAMAGTPKYEPIFKRNAPPHDDVDRLPPPPPWRMFDEAAETERGAKFHASEEVVELVNAALLLRRPLLVTGKPGTGKSSLAFAVAYQLGLGKVLHWPITTKSTLQESLYTYDAIARLQDSSLAVSRKSQDFSLHPSSESGLEQPVDIGRYIRLGPLGTALLPGEPQKLDSARAHGTRPRVLLIDEIDKSDIDLPNDLLNIFEEGEFEIPELTRLPEEERFRFVSVRPYDSESPVSIERGRVRCASFPFVIMTSNEEREFPPAFLRRCLRLDVGLPNDSELADIVADRLSDIVRVDEQFKALRAEFLSRRDQQKQELATDQLLNAIYLVMHGLDPMKRTLIKEALFRNLSTK